MTPQEFEDVIFSSLEKLSQSRPLFHIEADFQHALAWQIQKDYPELDIRFEFKPANIAERIFVDLWIKDKSGHTFAIELKYKTRKFEDTINDEKFSLLNQGAQDLGRYDYLKDIERLEKIVSNYHDTVGFAIILTNDSTYWNQSANNNTVDADFRINDGQEIHGTLKWAENASTGTTAGRSKPLEILGKYKLDWNDYSKLGNTNKGELRFLMVRIDGISM